MTEPEIIHGEYDCTGYRGLCDDCALARRERRSIVHADPTSAELLAAELDVDHAWPDETDPSDPDCGAISDPTMSQPAPSQSRRLGYLLGLGLERGTEIALALGFTPEQIAASEPEPGPPAWRPAPHYVVELSGDSLCVTIEGHYAEIPFAVIEALRARAASEASPTRRPSGDKTWETEYCPAGGDMTTTETTQTLTPASGFAELRAAVAAGSTWDISIAHIKDLLAEVDRLKARC